METIETEFIYSERSSKNENFDKRLIQHIVNLAGQGVPRRDLIRQYGMSKGALTSWVAKDGAGGKGRKVYSMAEKRSVVRAVRGGMSIGQAQIAFDIASDRSVRDWIRV
jgi:transposase